MPQNSFENLPAYLRRYCSSQDYSKYTPRDHASWRFIMRQSRDYFKDNAVGIYLEGLRKTGIPLDRIPKISEMDIALQEFGWGAVPVCGFIPPIAFLDLQARGILPIATDMRSLEHIAYTPAPDIVHEAAGHAPIIADEEYRTYLKRYAAMANKTIMSREDLNLYEAIRILSDIKENPDTKPGDIDLAQKALDKAILQMSYVSEASKVSRMAWWTVEYGLVGPLNHPKIYGAGLLSSVKESQNCLSPQVRKIPLTVKCVETTYDITEPQPQLFVAQDMTHLTQVLVEFESKLSFKKGGIAGLDEALKAKTVNTVVLDSGLEISGILNRFEAGVGKGESIHFIGFEGPVQLCYSGLELKDQGRLRHQEGFSTPLGRWCARPEVSPKNFADADLASFGLNLGKDSKLEFTSGFHVQGVLLRVVREKGKILYLTWKNCKVMRGSVCYFEPAWGEFDMAVGDCIASVYGGPADREAYGEYEMGGVSTQPGRTSPFTQEELDQFKCYNQIKDARAGKGSLVDTEIDVSTKFPNEWLLNLELLESVSMGILPSKFLGTIRSRLEALAKGSTDEVSELIFKGIRLSNERD